MVGIGVGGGSRRSGEKEAGGIGRRQHRALVAARLVAGGVCVCVCVCVFVCVCVCVSTVHHNTLRNDSTTTHVQGATHVQGDACSIRKLCAYGKLSPTVCLSTQQAEYYAL